jgi:hypothetical protein
VGAPDLGDFLDGLEADRAAAMRSLLGTIRGHIDPRFDEAFDGRMAHWVVPLSIFPDGYHATPGEPLPFLSLASQKRHIALYHLGLYADPDAQRWFEREYAATGQNLDMGKSCIRFTRPAAIPLGVIGRLAARIGVDDYVERYLATRPPR